MSIVNSFGLQEVSNVGATTNTLLTLNGGFNTAASCNFTGGLNTTTFAQYVNFQGNSSFPKLAFGVDTNARALWGTSGQAMIVYDGTNLVINPKVSAAGVIDTSGGDIIINKMGILGTAISANFLLNYQGSGTNRGAMQFDFTQTGTNLSTDIFLKVTAQNTNAGPSSSCANMQSVKDCDQTGTGNFRCCDLSFGTVATRTITQGTSNMIGINIAAGMGTGTANTGGTVRDYGIKIDAFPGYTGVATYVKWGINCDEDIQISTGKQLILEGSPTSKGDSYLDFNTTTANKIRITVDGTNMIDFRAATINVADAKDFVIGTTTGTKFGTATAQKIGFWNAAPVIQPVNTDAIDTLLVNTGLRASGGVALFDTDIKAGVVGKGLYVKEGTNATMGTAVLVAGTVVVNTTKVTANSRIFLTAQALGTVTIGQGLAVSARTAGTSFTITSGSAVDTSTVAWMIVEPA